MLNIYNNNAMARYSSTLPQEYGMLFIFPAGVLAIRFFQEYASFQKEIKECNETLKKQKKQKILGYLVGFAISFSLTLTVHFYNTMPAGVLCLGIAVGFCFRFCRWRYFWRIIVTGLLSIVLAVVPMAVGVAMGHPLQGSLYWALGVMSGEDDEEEEETAQSETIITDKNGNEIRVVGDVDEALLEKLKNGEALSDEEASNSEQQESVESESLSETPVQHQDQTKNLKRVSLFTRLQDKCRIILNQIRVYCTKSNQTVVRIIVGGIFSILILGFLAMVLRKTDYGGMILSIAFYMLFMCVMQLRQDLTAGPCRKEYLPPWALWTSWR